MITTVTTDNFTKEVLMSDKPVLIDFWAGWCGPCKMLSPVVDEVAEEVTDVKICKISIEEYPALAKRFRVMSIPTLILVKDGKEVKRSVGVVPKSEILELMK